MSEIAIYQDSKAPGRSRSCGAPITWAETIRGRRMPFDGPIMVTRTQPGAARVIEYVETTMTKSHFATCPDAKRWRRTQ